MNNITSSEYAHNQNLVGEYKMVASNKQVVSSRISESKTPYSKGCVKIENLVLKPTASVLSSNFFNPFADLDSMVLVWDSVGIIAIEQGQQLNIGRANTRKAKSPLNFKLSRNAVGALRLHLLIIDSPCSSNLDEFLNQKTEITEQINQFFNQEKISETSNLKDSIVKHLINTAFDFNIEMKECFRAEYEVDNNNSTATHAIENEWLKAQLIFSI